MCTNCVCTLFSFLFSVTTTISGGMTKKKTISGGRHQDFLGSVTGQEDKQTALLWYSWPVYKQTNSPAILFVTIWQTNKQPCHDICDQLTNKQTNKQTNSPALLFMTILQTNKQTNSPTIIFVISLQTNNKPCSTIQYSWPIYKKTALLYYLWPFYKQTNKWTALPYYLCPF